MKKDDQRTTNLTTGELLCFIYENRYIKECVSNKKKDKNSISYLIDRNLSQSECIKLGIGYEHILTDIITGTTSLKDIKGKRERDHLFCDEVNHKIYYSELKGNLNLDTEKSKSTYKKCMRNVQEIIDEYPGYTIEWCLVGFRYLTLDDFPNTIKYKYRPIKENIVGMNEYLRMLDVPLQFTDESHRFFINQLVNEMFPKS